MAGTSSNILVGAAQLLVDGVDVGFTQGGVQLRRSNEFLDVDADQAGGTMKKVKTKESVVVTTTLLESTLENMRIAMNEPSANKTGTGLVIGSTTLQTNEHTLTVIGKAPGTGKIRTYTFFRAISMEDVEHIIGARDAVGAVPIAFECLKDDSQGYAFGRFVDTNA